MTEHIRTALVIGGGIAGPVAAMALHKAGIDATVHEAYDSTADGVGGGLGIAANGVHALGVLGAEHTVTDIGVPMTAMVMHSWTGRTLAELPHPTGRFLWRAELYRGLYDEATRRGIRIEHGRRLVGAQDTGDGVIARFADGSEARADVLIGADGLRSTVRTLLDPNAPSPRYTGLLSFGGMLADCGLPATGGRMHMVFGKRAFFGYQVEDDGSGGWFVNLPHPEPMTLGQARAVSAEEWLRRLRAAFADDRTPASALLAAMDPADLLIVGPMEDLPTVPTWSRGRMVLVGDAAHAPSSTSGQGASLAMESAVQLARCLRDLPHQQAFAAYEGLRRARVEKIIANAARGNSDKAAGPVARVVRDLLLPVAMKALAKPEKMAWQYGYRIDWDAPVSPAAPVPATR
jgi:FAD-dependent urate hydroxylase